VPLDPRQINSLPRCVGLSRRSIRFAAPLRDRRRVRGCPLQDQRRGRDRDRL